MVVICQLRGLHPNDRQPALGPPCGVENGSAAHRNVTWVSRLSAFQTVCFVRGSFIVLHKDPLLCLGGHESSHLFFLLQEVLKIVQDADSRSPDQSLAGTIYPHSRERHACADECHGSHFPQVTGLGRGQQGGLWNLSVSPRLVLDALVQGLVAWLPAHVQGAQNSAAQPHP